MIAKPNRTATGPNGPSPLPDEATITRRKKGATTEFSDPAFLMRLDRAEQSAWFEDLPAEPR